jgi:hypothetical protein
MRNIFKLSFAAIFIALFTTNLWSQTDAKKNLSVYFVYSNNATVASSQAAVKILVNDFLNYPEIKTFAVLPKSDAKLSKNLKSSLKLDGVLVNEGKGIFKGVALKSPQDVLVFGAGDTLLQQYSNFSQINELLFVSGKVQDLENHKLSPKIFGDCSIVFPVDDEKRGSINLILPEDGKMICLRNKPKKITEIELPSYFDSFYFFGNTIQSKIFRDEPFKNGAKVTKKFYETFDFHLTSIKSLTTGFGDTTGLYITSKNARIKMDSAVMIFREIDQDKLSRMLKKDFYFSQNIGLRVTARLNDSLMAAMMIKTPGNTNHLALIDMTDNSLHIVKELDPVVNSDSLVYARFSGDKNNKMYLFNMKSNELKVINFKTPDKPFVKTYSNFIQNNLAAKVLDIYTIDKVIYILYLNPTNDKSLYVEEYKTEDFSFIRGCSLDINPNDIEIINIAGIVDKLLCFLYRSPQNEWIMKSYRVL